MAKTAIKAPVRTIGNREPQKQVLQKYDPSKNYAWNGNDVIPILGSDFQELFNGLKLIYEAEKTGNVAEIDRHVAIYAALQAAERAFINAVQVGLMKPQEKE